MRPDKVTSLIATHAQQTKTGASRSAAGGYLSAIGTSSEVAGHQTTPTSGRKYALAIWSRFRKSLKRLVRRLGAGTVPSRSSTTTNQSATWPRLRSTLLPEPTAKSRTTISSRLGRVARWG